MDSPARNEGRQAKAALFLSNPLRMWAFSSQVMPTLGELPLSVNILTYLPRASPLMPEQLTTSLNHHMRGPSKMLYLGGFHFLAAVNNIAIKSFKYILCVV